MAALSSKGDCQRHRTWGKLGKSGETQGQTEHFLILFEKTSFGGWPFLDPLRPLGLPFASLGILCYRVTRRMEHPCGESGGVARAGSIFLCVVDSSATSWQYPGARFLPG